jgi:hypothetical protein
MGVSLNAVSNAANRVGPDYETGVTQSSAHLPFQRHVDGPTEPVSPDENTTDKTSSVNLKIESGDRESVVSSGAIPNQPNAAGSDIEAPTPQTITRFRYLMAAESARGRDLDARQKQLEHKLEAVNERLKLADSLISQIDIELERARLQHDLELIGSEIRQMRLENLFDVPVGAKMPAYQESGPASGESASAEARINLLA